MLNRATVEVLLATFNGESYLREQIDSILAQDYQNLRLLVRDDGSSDGTPEILRQYASAFPERVFIVPTDRPTGSPKENFLRLMNASTANYVCFSDQDDVWLSNKVSITMEAMQALESQWGESAAALVFTDLRVVDPELRSIHESFWEFMKINPNNMEHPNKLMLKPVVTGCTAMLNRPLLGIARRMPKEAFMHDFWIALLASTMGKSRAVERQTVLYRQHGKNLIGTGQKWTNGPGTTATSSIWKRIHSYRQGATALQWKQSQEQAAALLDAHGPELTSKARDIVESFRRCETDNRRLVRLFTLIRYGFYDREILSNLARVAIVSQKTATP